MTMATTPLSRPPATAGEAAMRRPSPAVAWSVTVVAILAVAAIPLGPWHDSVLPIAYGVPLVLSLWLRDRRCLWTMAGAFALIAVYRYTVLLPPEAFSLNAPAPRHFQLIGRLPSLLMVLLDTAIISTVLHVFIGNRHQLSRRGTELETANRELAAQEEETARQNEELQSQAQELERQGEELRVTNEELARRERALHTLLALSRALMAQHGAEEILSRACDTLGQLILDAGHNDERARGAGAAILTLDGDELVIRCHHGFGDGGPGQTRVPLAASFASLVLSRDRTGYLEDLTMGPDLRIPQPAAGPAFASVLASPLRVGGRAVGTVEAYARQTRQWSDEDVAMVESLASQASVSLEAAELFEQVNRDRLRFETVLRTLPFGVAVCNADGSDIRLNPAGAAALNMPADTDIAPSLRSGDWTLSKDGRALGPDEFPILRAKREGHEVRGGEYEMRLPSGRRITLLIHAAPFRDDHARIVGSVSAFADITAQVALQRELDLRRREAEEASIRKTRFLGAISHDIRTPANAITLMAELIKRSADNPALAGEVPDLAKELQASALSLVGLLSDVLDVARFDSGRIEMQESEFALAGLLEDERRQMTPLAQAKSLPIRVECADGLRLRADRIKLGRVVSNLLGNAIKFTERGEVVVQVVRLADGWVEIRVVDTGIGIEAGQQGNIFDEFVQLRNPERDRSKGTGLGLAICRRLVDAMGGEIEVRSEPGRGSTFSVRLPPTVVVAE